MASGLTPLTGDFYVNPDFSESQSTPYTFRLADGGFVVTYWDKNTYLATAQRYDADGVANGAPITGIGGPFMEGTGLKDGGFVLSWTTFGGADGDRAGIAAQIFDAAGAPVGGEFQVNENGDGQQGRSFLATLDGGRFVVVWSSGSSLPVEDSEDGSDAAVIGRVFEADGTPVTGDFIVNTHAEDRQALPAIAALDDGGFVAVYHSRNFDGLGHRGDMVGQRFDADANKVGAEFLVNQSSNDDVRDGGAVAMLPGGGFVVVWATADNLLSSDADSQEGVFGRIFNADGTAAGDEFTIATFDNSTSAGSYGGEFTNRDGVNPVSVAAFEAGGFLVAWHQYRDASYYDVMGRRFDANGNPIEVAVSLAQATGADQVDIDLVSFGFGRVAAAWDDDYITARIFTPFTFGTAGDDPMTGAAGVDCLDGLAGKDTLLGRAGSDWLAGGDGSDKLRGGSGDDLLTGGADRDRLWGGNGADRFDFNATTDSLPGTGRDIIRDFAQGEDRIDLKDIDAVTGGADDGFTYVGSAGFSGTAGELRSVATAAGVTIVTGDVNGDRVKDFAILLEGSHSLTADDFIL